MKRLPGLVLSSGEDVRSPRKFQPMNQRSILEARSLPLERFESAAFRSQIQV